MPDTFEVSTKAEDDAPVPTVTFEERVTAALQTWNIDRSRQVLGHYYNARESMAKALRAAGL